ncbi:MAG: hypothetical protein ACRYHQ_23330 [Janthinobacterium lividum]
MHEQLRLLAEKVWTYCQASGTRGQTVTLKVKYADFKQITRSRFFGDFVPSVAMLECTVFYPVELLLPVRLGVGLLGVTLSSLNTKDTGKPAVDANDLAKSGTFN